MAEYNYPDFNMEREMPPFDSFRKQLHVGDRALDYPLEDLDTGVTINMESLWGKSAAIIEFGSFT